MSSKMKALSPMAVSICVLFLFSACSSQGVSNDEAEAQDTTVIKFSHGNSPESVKHQSAEKFSELVEEKTDGDVEVEVYPSASLYSDNEELEALESGNVHMIAPALSKLVQIDPYWQITDLPYLFKDREHVMNFFSSDFAQDMMESDKLANHNVKGVAFWEGGFKQFTNNKHPLQTAEDFKDLKIRTQSGRVLESQFKELEAGTSTIVLAETYTALQNGTVDGQENTLDNINTTKFQEVQDYMSISDHGRLDYVVLVNKPFWEDIPENSRVKVEEALKEATEFELDLAEKQSEEALSEIQDSDIDIIELTQKERDNLRETFQPVYDEYSDIFPSEDIEEIDELKE